MAKCFQGLLGFRWCQTQPKNIGSSPIAPIGADNIYYEPKLGSLPFRMHACLLLMTFQVQYVLLVCVCFCLVLIQLMDCGMNTGVVHVSYRCADFLRLNAIQVGAATGGKGLAAVVNNAGHALFGPLEHIAMPDLRRQLEVNLIGM